jgi:uncharacterized Rossmann fold enzyme
MKFSEWEPIYKQILTDFSFDRKKDEEAAKVLGKLITRAEIVSIQELSKLIKDQKVFVFGSGPTLENDLNADEFNGVIIAADGATSALLKHGMVPDIIVTDLDGFIPDQIKANKKGAKVIIHAHGDNIPTLKEWVPKFKGKILGTTQSTPNEKNQIFNFGGFTDGDRAAFLSSHFKSRLITLVAFNFKRVGNYSFKFEMETKLRKLTWANLLIGMVQEPEIIFFSDNRE